MAESVGVGGRGGYYETSGAIRDMIQNHIMQLLTLVAMEPPAAMDANAVRDEKVKVLRSLRRITADQVSDYTVRGQYGLGSSGGIPVLGYRDESKVAKDSVTETYTAINFILITGVGRACRFICEAESVCRSA